MKMKTYILLDRSGSMIPGWDETIGALGMFAAGLKKKAKLQLSVFDGQVSMDYATVFNGKRADYNCALLAKYKPRGNTPLYDAIGVLAEQIGDDSPTKAQIVIITDGYENASREYTASSAKATVAMWEKQGYDVVYMGASFAEATQQAAAMGIDVHKTVNMADTSAYGGTMSAMSTRNAGYADGTVKPDADLGKDVRDAAK